MPEQNVRESFYSLLFTFILQTEADFESGSLPNGHGLSPVRNRGLPPSSNDTRCLSMTAMPSRYVEKLGWMI